MYLHLFKKFKSYERQNFPLEDASHFHEQKVATNNFFILKPICPPSLFPPNFQLFFLVTIYFESISEPKQTVRYKTRDPVLINRPAVAKEFRVSPFQSCITSYQSSVHNVRTLSVYTCSFCEFLITYSCIANWSQLDKIFILYCEGEHLSATQTAFPIIDFMAPGDLTIQINFSSNTT